LYYKTIGHLYGIGGKEDESEGLTEEVFMIKLANNDAQIKTDEKSTLRASERGKQEGFVRNLSIEGVHGGS
jgi:hypothetical protein